MQEQGQRSKILNMNEREVLQSRLKNSEYLPMLSLSSKSTFESSDGIPTDEMRPVANAETLLLSSGFVIYRTYWHDHLRMCEAKVIPWQTTESSEYPDQVSRDRVRLVDPWLVWLGTDRMLLTGER